MARFSRAAAALPLSSDSMHVDSTESSPGNTGDPKIIFFHMKVRIEFKSIPDDNTFNVGYWMKALLTEFLKHTPAQTQIKKLNGSASFDSADHFPESKEEFDEYFNMLMLSRTVAVEMHYSSRAHLEHTKTTQNFRDFLERNKIYMATTTFKSLKTKTLGWFFGQSQVAFRSVLAFHVTNALHLERKKMMEQTTGRSDIPLAEVQKPPELAIIPGNPRYFDRDTKTNYSTKALFLYCEESDAAELEQLLTTATFDERTIGKFVPCAVTASTAEQYVNAIKAQNEFLRDQRRLPVAGAHHRVMFAKFMKHETFMDFILNVEAPCTGKPMFTTIERTNSTRQKGFWLFTTTEENFEAAQKWLVTDFNYYYNNASEGFASIDIYVKEFPEPRPTWINGKKMTAVLSTLNLVPKKPSPDGWNRDKQPNRPPKRVTPLFDLKNMEPTKSSSSNNNGKGGKTPNVWKSYGNPYSKNKQTTNAMDTTEDGNTYVTMTSNDTPGLTEKVDSFEKFTQECNARMAAMQMDQMKRAKEQDMRMQRLEETLTTTQRMNDMLMQQVRTEMQESFSKILQLINERMSSTASAPINVQISPAEESWDTPQRRKKRQNISSSPNHPEQLENRPETQQSPNRNRFDALTDAIEEDEEEEERKLSASDDEMDSAEPSTADSTATTTTSNKQIKNNTTKDPPSNAGTARP